MVDAAAICPACGYSLTGLRPPVACPECGHWHQGRQFIVHGVPTARSIMSGPRIAVMIVVVVLAMLLPQTLSLVIAAGTWVVALSVAIGIVVVVLMFVWTAPRAQGGKARFVFVPGGMTVTPLKIDAAAPNTGGFVRFHGNELVRLRPVSSVWARLMISRAGASVFEAGIRCPRAQADHLVTTIDELIRGRPAAESPPTE